MSMKSYYKTKNVATIGVSLAMLGALVTYINGVPKLLGYVISASAIVFGSFLLVSTGTLFTTFAWRLLKASPWFWLWAFVVLTIQYVHFLLGDAADLEALIRTLGYIFIFTLSYFVLGPAIFVARGRPWDFLTLIISCTSVIAVLGSLGITSVGVYRSRIPIIGLPFTKSIFMDANYFAVIASVGLVSAIHGYSISREKSTRFIYALGCLLNLLGVLLSYSRAGYLAVLGAALLWFFTSRRIARSWKIGLLAIGIITAPLYVNSLLNSQAFQEFFQVQQGLTGREILWPSALQAIAERPVLGWGIGSVDDVIIAKVGRWTSSHNTYLDFGIMTGMLGLAAFLWVIIASIWPLLSRERSTYSQRRFLLTVLFLFFILSNFITFTPGGASFASFLYALALGEANSLRLLRYSGLKEETLLLQET